ncbi:MAG: tail fiber domain-containing protein [Flavobacteriaceae bacterium]|nr:tail fiber domain-containing protein [Flavobacteriaceae bacterium]
MKKILLFCFSILFFQMQAQVGINTTDPHAQLEIKSSDQANPDATDGILIPKVDAFPAINPTVDQDGMMVYLTTDVGASLKGFYYWDNTNSVWKSISGDKGWSVIGNSGLNNSTNFIGTTDYVNLKFKVNNVNAGLLSADISSNTNFGYETLTNSGYNYSDAFGYQALKINSTGLANAAFGRYSLTNNTTGSYNCAFGSSSLFNNTSGNRNIAFGLGALQQNSTADDNIAIGYFSSAANSTGFYNIAVGSFSSYFNSSGSYNTAIGYQSLYSNFNGSYNAAIGYQSLYSNSSGIGNVAQGNRAMYYNLYGNNNTAIGNASMYFNTGNRNTALGNEAMFSSNTGNANTAIGDRALYNNSSGNGNIAIGQESNPAIGSGWNNIGIGFHSLGNISSTGGIISGNQLGFDNVGLGLFAGDRTGANTNGCLFLGAFTNPTNTGIGLTNATAIGRYATVSQDNSIVLGGINGINGASSNTKVGIGLTNPNACLDVFTSETNDAILLSARNLSQFGTIFQFGSIEYFKDGYDTTMVGNKFCPASNSSSNTLGSPLNATYDGYRWGTLYTTTNPNVSSDITLKKEIQTLKYGIDEIRKITPISYIYKSEKLPNGEELSDADKTKMLGFSAQELLQIIPEVVSINTWSTQDEKTYNKIVTPTLGVRYGDLIPVLFNATKQLDLLMNEKFKTQQEEIEDLKKQLASERNKNNQIENRLKAIEEKLSK